ncbi:MAG: lipid-A-disaccharide synthase [bacterium]
MKKGFIIAGEASADLYASRLVNELKKSITQLEVTGIGGDKLAQEGVFLIEQYSNISVVGLAEVLSHLKKISTAIKNTVKWIKENNPDFVILMDLPDFNFKVIKKIRKWYRGKIIYFISPQIWAWREKRKFFIKENVDKMIVILPFEKEIYEKIGFSVEYLGHPLIDIVKPDLESLSFKKKYGFKDSSMVLSIFPGSREKEVVAHATILKKVIDKLKLSYSNMEFCIVPANERLSKILKEIFTGSRVTVVDSNDNYNAIFSSNVVIAKSGTTSLEVAIAKKPAVVFYKVSKFSYFIAKLVVSVPYISLPNLILNDMVYPEFIQEDFNEENIFNGVRRFLEDTDLYIHTVERLSDLEKQLGEKGFFERAAQKIKEWTDG